MRRSWRDLAVAALGALVVASCGGGGGGGGSSLTPTPPAASNVLSVVIDAGPVPSTAPTANTLYTTVTVCVPGSTTQCQTIDHIQVDTGSYGFRVIGSVLTLSLPTVMASDGNTLVECTQFAVGNSWGPVSLADLQIAGETASSVPMQVISTAAFAIPSACSTQGTGTVQDTVNAFGANGILGIGVFPTDCTTGVCPASQGFYYSCTAAACGAIAVAQASQVTNPITLFAKDNNGSIIELPRVTAPGEASLTGTLTFGIDTQTNNASGTQTVLGLDGGGYFTTVFAGNSLTSSFIDSGSNGSFFDSSITACPNPGNFSGFYCSATSVSLSATLTGNNNVSTSVNFSIDNAETLSTNNPTFTVFPTLGGPWPGTIPTFDWGLPFFFGRRVANAIESQSTAVGTGPYVAF